MSAKKYQVTVIEKEGVFYVYQANPDNIGTGATIEQAWRDYLSALSKIPDNGSAGARLISDDMRNFVFKSVVLASIATWALLIIIWGAQHAAKSTIKLASDQVNYTMLNAKEIAKHAIGLEGKGLFAEELSAKIENDLKDNKKMDEERKLAHLMAKRLEPYSVEFKSSGCKK